MKLTKDNVWFYSDPHFNHTNIIKYANRPFKNVNEMNESLIHNWNVTVPPTGRTYILGDFGFDRKYSGDRLAEILKRLNGSKHTRMKAGISNSSQLFLIPGNHDNYILKNEKCLEQINICRQIHYIKIDKQVFVLCHYALRSWLKKGRGSIHLFGHSHGKIITTDRSMDVGVDAEYVNYHPISAKKILEIMELRSAEYD